MTLNATDKIILNRLSRSSYNAPVKLAELRHLAKVTDRRVKQSIELLRMEYSIPVVSFRRWGYYIPQNDDERKRGTLVYQQQIKTETRTLNAILNSDLTEVPNKIDKILSEE